MLSHPTSIMDQRRQRQQQQHRRQQSTPNVYEVDRVPYSFENSQSRDSLHKRGMSFTQPTEQSYSSLEYPQMVSNTNTGHQPQHYLQEAQQQHSQARPGLQQGSIQQLNLSAEEFRRLQHQQLDAQLDSIMRVNQVAFDQNNPHYVKIERSRSNPEQHQTMNIVGVSPDGSPVVQLGNWVTQQGCASNVPRSARNTDEMSTEEKRMSLQQEWMMQSQRPFTPQGSTNLAYFPITAPNTPYISARNRDSPVMQMSRMPSHEEDPEATVRAGRKTPKPQLQDQFDSDQSRDVPKTPEQNETIRAGRPLRMRRGLSHTKLVQGGPSIDADILPSPPQTAPVKTARKFDVAAFPSSLDDVPSVSLAPSNEGSFQIAQCTSPQASPEEASLQYKHSPIHSSRSSVDFGAWGSPVRGPQSPGEMSMDELSLYGTLEDTGVSNEEVLSYISEQDPESQKWTCLYPGCDKVFGRKENIRSHVQTHLGDRQYRCPSCDKRFVRQHDLKRHAKIHSGAKPFPCRCGNSFARQDALTRHRQRGICNGGFEGVVKKIVKRGRPRKERPNNEERAEKAARTRKRANEANYASSVSGTSDGSSLDSPPLAMMDDMDVAKLHALANYNTNDFVYPRDIFGQSPPLSPYDSKNRQFQEQFVQTQSSLATPASINLDGSQMTDRVALPGSHDNLFGSQPGSPPELSHSSPPGSTHLMDLDKPFNNNDNSEADAESTSTTDFDALAMKIFTQPVDMLNISWNSSTFGNLDKDSAAFRNPSFSDEVLFSDNFDDNDHLF